MNAMKCHFKDIMKDGAKNLDNLRFQMEESMVKNDLIPGKTVEETPENIIVKILIPGIKKENIDLNITESQISLEANFTMEKHLKSNLISFKDKQEGTIKRKISLPKKVIPQEATAKLENGILKVKIPKLEKEKHFNVKIE